MVHFTVTHWSISLHFHTYKPLSNSSFTSLIHTSPFQTHPLPLSYIQAPFKLIFYLFHAYKLLSNSSFTSFIHTSSFQTHLLPLSYIQAPFKLILHLFCFQVFLGLFVGFSAPTSCDDVISSGVFPSQQIHWHSRKLPCSTSLHQQNFVIIRDSPK